MITWKEKHYEECLEENRREGLKVRLRKLYERTKWVVRTKEEVISAFETRKRVNRERRGEFDIFYLVYCGFR